MKYIKLFENFSDGDWKQNILQNTEILNIVEDLRDISLEYLDNKVEVEDEFDGEIQILDKTLIFDVMIQNKEGLLDSIVNGSFDYNQDKPIEDYFYWNDDSIIPDDLMEITDMIKSGELKLMINFAIIFGAEDGDPNLTDDSGNVYQRIIVAYPDVEFDIIDPWNL
jgi:hypothetical protein